jgi:hypothetical protein
MPSAWSARRIVAARAEIIREEDHVDRYYGGDLRDYYLHGFCSILAATLADKIGWQPVGIYDRTWDTKPRHIGVMSPDGQFGDARGLDLSREEFLEPYNPHGDATVKKLSPEMIKATDYQDPYYRKAWGRCPADLVRPGLVKS